MASMGGRHDHTCDGCGQELVTDDERLNEWQAVVSGKSAWRGHREHVEAEAAKFVVVEKAALTTLLHHIDGHLGLAVHRGVGGTPSWLADAENLIGRIRKAIDGLGG